MSQQVLLVALLGVVAAAVSHRIDFARVNVHAVLALLGETDFESDQIARHVVRGVFGQPLLFRSVFVESRHKVGQRSGHAELAFQLTAGKDQGVLMGDGHQAEETRRLHRPPLTAGAVRQGHHDRLKVLANNFELANALEFHGLARQVLARRHRIGEYVQQEGTTARGVDSERDHISHNRLRKKLIEF